VTEEQRQICLELARKYREAGNIKLADQWERRADGTEPFTDEEINDAKGVQ
jgi:hypothetical protein